MFSAIQHQIITVLYGSDLEYSAVPQVSNTLRLASTVTHRPSCTWPCRFHHTFPQSTRIESLRWYPLPYKRYTMVNWFLTLKQELTTTQVVEHKGILYVTSCHVLSLFPSEPATKCCTPNSIAFQVTQRFITRI